MTIVLNSLVFLTAAVCVGLMGFAIQRGATCTVAAVDELVTKRSARRLTAFAEASLWVAGGLLVAQTLHILPKMPPGYAVTLWTLLGGVLLGLGAYVNRACVFGAIARFGSGEWAYLATPLGYYAGCLSVGSVFSSGTATRLPQGSPVLQAPAWIAALFVVFVIWRVVSPLRSAKSDQPAGRLPVRLRHAFAKRLWSPHAATTVIAVMFLIVLLLLGGAWAYTEVLAELARGMAGNLAARALLVLMLLAGAVWGGWSAGRFRPTCISAGQVLRCFAGGMLMAWGSLLIPGSNDGLILVGMPLLWPYAWLAFLSMCVSIAAAQLLQRRARAAVAAPEVH